MQGDRIQFHLDEHIPPAIASALRRRGIEVTTASEARLLGAPEALMKSFDSLGLRSNSSISRYDLPRRKSWS